MNSIMTYSVSETFYLTKAIWHLMNFANVAFIPFGRLILLVCPKTDSGPASLDNFSILQAIAVGITF